MTAGQFARYVRALADLRERLDRYDLPSRFDLVSWTDRPPRLRLTLPTGPYDLAHTGGELRLTFRPRPGLPDVIETGPLALYSFQDLLGVEFAEHFLDLSLLLEDDP